jgi:hypothetical protein
MVVQVAPAQIWRLPDPSLKIVSTSLVALKLASTVEGVVLVKLDVVTAVPWTAKVLAVTEPEIVTVLPMVTEAILIGIVPEMLAVTLPI